MLKKQKPIKLLFIIDFIDVLEGTETQLIRLIENLNKDRYSIYLICLRSSEWIQQHKNTLPCQVEIFNIFKLKNPATILQIFLLIRYIKKVRPHIVLTFFPLSNILGVFAARLANVRIIMSSRRDSGLWLEGKIALLFLKLANTLVTKIIVNSIIVKELACDKESVNRSKIDVIYNGLDFSVLGKDNDKARVLKKELGIAPENKIVGILAGLRPMKRHEIFIKAAAEIQKSRNDITFLIVGDGPLRGDLENMSKALNLKKSCYFLGRQEDTIPYLSLFDIGVNCSSAEGLSNAIMEYMALDIPCIVTNSGGNTELIKDGINGYTFELNDHGKLENLILRLLNDKQKQEEFIFQSRKIIIDMTIGKMVDEYDRCFTKLLET